MGILILIIAVLVFGVWIGFIIGFSRVMREAVARAQGKPSPVPWVFVIVGSVALLISMGTAIYSWYFITHAIRAPAKITEMREQTDKDDHSIRYAPTYQFRDVAGVGHTVPSSLYTFPPRHRVGDNITVIYRPSDPDGARIDSFIYSWCAPVIGGVIGSVSLTVGAGILYWRRRSVTKAAVVTL